VLKIGAGVLAFSKTVMGAGKMKIRALKPFCTRHLRCKVKLFECIRAVNYVCGSLLKKLCAYCYTARGEVVWRSVLFLLSVECAAGNGAL
jgi:hypothetical protein